MSDPLLDRPLYEVSDAAALLALPVSTLRGWVLGRPATRARRASLPVVRNAMSDDPLLTWGEFIESSMLASLRREHGVSLQELLSFCHLFRAETGQRYPLAMNGARVNGRHLVHAAQVAGISVLVDGTGHVLSEEATNLFVRHVRWQGDRPVALEVGGDQHPNVICDPERRFGRPMIAGVETAVVAQAARDGELELVIEAYGIGPPEVDEALSFEGIPASIAA